MIIFKYRGIVEFRRSSYVGWADPDVCEWYFELETMGM